MAMLLRTRAAAIATIGAIACLSQALADDQNQNTAPDPVVLLQKSANNAQLFSFDFGVPTSPAEFLVGSSTDKSSPSTALKPFVFQVPASYGGAKDSQVFALDFAPTWALGIPDNDFDHYAASYWRRLENRTRLGAAYFPGSDGNGDPTQQKSSRLAVGLSSSLLDDSDPLATPAGDGGTVWVDCLRDLMNSPAEKSYVDKFQSEIVKDSRAVNYAQLLVRMADSNDPKAVQNAEDEVRACLGGPCAGQENTDKLRTTLGDPKMEARDKLSTLDTLLDPVKKAVDSKRQTASADAMKAFKLDGEFAGCATKANAQARKGYDLDIGMGALLSGQPGQPGNFEDAGFVAWSAFKIPLDFLNSGEVKVTHPTDPLTGMAKIDDQSDSFMLGGSLRSSWGEFVQTGDTTTPEIRANVLDSWIGLERFSANTKLVLQGGYTDFRATDPLESKFSKSGFRWQVSGSIKLNSLLSTIADGAFFSNNTAMPTNGIWVNASYGAASGTTTTLDDKMFLVSVSFSPTLSDPFGGGATQ